MEDLKRMYDELYDDMATAKDPKKMMVFGEAEKWMFHSLADKHPEIAEMWLTKLEAGKWHNYLSKSEAEQITSKMLNQDGTRGPHWSYETFKNAVESLGAKIKDEPYYINNLIGIFILAEHHFTHKKRKQHLTSCKI